jgi:hypothetical protein
MLANRRRIGGAPQAPQAPQAPGMASPTTQPSMPTYPLAGAGAAPTTQPSVPSSPSLAGGAPVSPPFAPTTQPAPATPTYPGMAAPAQGPNQVELTTEHLKSMWDVFRDHRPDATTEDFQAYVHDKYGVRPGVETLQHRQGRDRLRQPRRASIRDGQRV